MTGGGARVVVLTDRRMAASAGRPLGDVVAAALDGGADAVLLREKDLPRSDRRRLAGELRGATAARGAELWVAGDGALAAAVGADAVHLAATDPWPDREPAALVRWGRSCHTPAELVDARDRGADHATFSPVFATASKPGYGPPLGLDGLAAGCRAAPGLAVIALGGVEPHRAGACLAAGAAGVALMGAIMRADDPARVVRSVIDELRSAPT
jgi:thiamine-phosphate diphosphorylase